MRIVSLLPSCTEIVCALDLADQLAGRSHECDFPPAILGLPACTEPKLDVTAPGALIDRQVKSLARDALSIYRIDIETLRDLLPDIILTQSQCAVCAVSIPEVESALSEWTGSKPRIISLAPNSLTDVWIDILRVAEALGVADRGRALVQKLQARVEAIAAAARAVSHRPSVACVEWIDPLMGAGNWVPELGPDASLSRTAISTSTVPGRGWLSHWKSWAKSFTRKYFISAIKGPAGTKARSRRSRSSVLRAMTWRIFRNARMRASALRSPDT
jgi:iron complex transport system substrate-binding protein